MSRPSPFDRCQHDGVAALTALAPVVVTALWPFEVHKYGTMLLALAKPNDVKAAHEQAAKRAERRGSA